MFFNVIEISLLSGEKIAELGAKLKERRNYRTHRVQTENIVDKIRSRQNWQNFGRIILAKIDQFLLVPLKISGGHMFKIFHEKV